MDRFRLHLHTLLTSYSASSVDQVPDVFVPLVPCKQKCLSRSLKAALVADRVWEDVPGEQNSRPKASGY